jgi:hypothetical protein
MTIRRMILLAGAVLLVAGVIGLLLPVSTVHGDQGSVGCGTALVANLSDAHAADDKNGGNIPILNQILPHTDYVAQCESSLSSRRAWSIPLAVIGAVAVAGALLVRGRPPTI